MKDNEERICDQYEEKLVTLEKEKERIEEKFEDNQLLTKVLRIECNEANAKSKNLKDENDILKEKYLNTQSLLKTKDLELTEIKDQLSILWNNQTNISSTNFCARKSTHDVQSGINCEKAYQPCNSTKMKVDVGTSTPTCFTSNVSCNTVMYKTTDSSSNTENIDKSLHSLLFDVTDSKSVFNSPAHSVMMERNNTENIEWKNLERVRTILVAELTSLQLLHSMFDLTSTAKLKSKYSHLPEAKHLATATEPSFNGWNDDVDNQYACHEFQQLTPEHVHQRETFKSNHTTKQDLVGTLSPVLSPNTNIQSLPEPDRITLLYREIDNQRKTIDEELVKTTYEMIGESLLMNNGEPLQKKDIYCHLVKTITDPVATTKYNIDQLEHILNLVLVDHSVTGCLLALSHRHKSENFEKIIRQLCMFKSAPESLVEHVLIEKDELDFDEINNIDNDNDDTHVDSSNLVTLKTIEENDYEIDINDKMSCSDSECDSPRTNRKGFFCCIPVRTIKERSFYRQKMHKRRLLAEH